MSAALLCCHGGRPNSSICWVHDFQSGLRFGDLTGSFNVGEVVPFLVSVVGAWLGLIMDAPLCCCTHKAVNTACV